ncbi:MAG: hypothetical protein ACFFCS_10425, partial [Candidatus Hodarchaeota archaeon]
MNARNVGLVPSNIVMEEFIQPAMEYYEKIMDKIEPYFFQESLVKMVAFQQMIVSKNYQFTRDDARKKKNVDYIKYCVSNIYKPQDLVSLMDTWRAFDLCLTAPSFVNPSLAANIRKSYCRIGNKYFDCHHCPKITCRDNLLWEHSTIMFDMDLDESSLEGEFEKLSEALSSIGVSHAIKLSSLHGFHVNVGLPRQGGSTIHDRCVYHHALFQEIHGMGVDIDDNSMDPLPIVRAPYSLHYKRLTPSLPVDEHNFQDAIEVLKNLEALPPEKRIAASLVAVKNWDTTWEVDHTPDEIFDKILEKHGEASKKAILREKSILPPRERSTLGDILLKGSQMTPRDEASAVKMLIGEGKSKQLALKIVELNKKNEPRTREEKEEESTEILLKDHLDVPKKALEIPPPLLLLLVDNASVNDMKEIAGVPPLPLSTSLQNTGDAMKALFKDTKLMKAYGRRWGCKSIYIGGLHSAYNYLGSSDLVVAVKMEHVWDRDMKIL